MTEIAVLNYGVGNLFSISRALEKTGSKVKVITSLEELANQDAIVFPGVGNFKVASKYLTHLKQRINLLLEEGVSLFGVCLGLQVFFEASEESKGNGLELLQGKVRKLPTGYKIPHMGWNNLKIIGFSELLDGVDENSYFYFVHSYCVGSNGQKYALAETNYGIDFISVLSDGNIYGTQFHPEKSGDPGAKILENFTRILRC